MPRLVDMPTRRSTAARDHWMARIAEQTRGRRNFAIDVDSFRRRPVCGSSGIERPRERSAAADIEAILALRLTGPGALEGGWREREIAQGPAGEDTGWAGGDD